MKPRRLDPSDPALPAVLALVRAAFGSMDGVIDPPSSMHRLSLADVADQARAGEVWVIDEVTACVFLTPTASALYVGKLAVAAEARGKGLARALIALAEDRARALELPALELQTRIELSANQAAFQALGFVEVARTAHAGFDRPTSITYRRVIAPKGRR